MATRALSDLKFLEVLKGFNKPYFTLADLEKILNIQRASLRVTLSRLAKKGVIIRLRRGIYTLAGGEVDFEKITNELYYPSYLSFESALSRFGILSQIPYSLTFATAKPSKKIRLGDREVDFRHLKKNLFFGYCLENGVYIAEPEKAILDELYFISLGKTLASPQEWSLEGLERKQLLAYSRKYPLPVRKLVKKLLH